MSQSQKDSQKQTQESKKTIKPHTLTSTQIAERLSNYKEFKRRFFVNAENILAIVNHYARPSSTGSVDEGTICLCMVILAREHWKPWTPEKAEALIYDYMRYLEKEKQIVCEKPGWWKPKEVENLGEK